MKFLRLPAIALLALVHIQAFAADYQTTIEWTPDDINFPTFSGDAADGNRLVLEWSTALTSGLVTVDDLESLTVNLFGNNVLLFSDPVLINGVVQDIPNADVGRDLLPLSNAFDFEFDLDAPTAGLTYLDTDPDGLIETVPHTGTAWVSYYRDTGNVLTWKYIGQVRTVSESTMAQASSASQSTAPVTAPMPVPVPVPTMSPWALALLALMMIVFVTMVTNSNNKLAKPR